MSRLQRLLSRDRSEHGASAVEYGLLVAGIAAIIVIAAFTLGKAVRVTLFDQTCKNIHDGMVSGGISVTESCG